MRLGIPIATFIAALVAWSTLAQATYTPPTTCTAVAPFATACQGEIQFSSLGRGQFNDDALTLVDFERLTATFYPKLRAGGFDFDNPSNRCATLIRNGCDGTYTDRFHSSGPYVPGAHLLVVEVDGIAGGVGKWGWQWSI